MLTFKKKKHTYIHTPIKNDFFFYLDNLGLFRHLCTIDYCVYVIDLLFQIEILVLSFIPRNKKYISKNDKVKSFRLRK